MGMSPTEVDNQSLWQFSAAWNGYVAANAPDDGKLTDREAEALFNWIDQGPKMPTGRLPRVKWDGKVVTAARSDRLAQSPMKHELDRQLPTQS